MGFEIGLDRWVANGFSALKGEKVALLGNPASVDKNYVHLLDHCLAAGVDLVRLFGPEHGILGDAQDMDHVGSSIDERTGAEVVSLYGQTRESLFLQPAHLEGVSVLLCDLQDIGARYYTFAYTIAFAMRACAQAGVKCVVFDRPNPIGADRFEGNRIKSGFHSFVGEYPLANQHGMTLGELCQYFKNNDDAAAGCDLEVVWMNGYTRDMILTDTSAPWVMPSPNMPTTDTAIVYPGMCIFEGTNLSEGRGTTRPFELVGAPYIDDPHGFCERAMAAGLDGLTLRPCWFRPTVRDHAGELCGGMQLHVTDRARYQTVKAAVAILKSAMGFCGFSWRTETYEYVSDRLAIDLLFGDDTPRKMLEKGASAGDVMAFLDEDRDTLARERGAAIEYA